MACPSGPYRTDAAFEAIGSLDLWEAGFCTYGVPMGEMVVGLLFYGAVGLTLFIRTGSPMIPFVLVLILGGTILAQMASVVSSFAAVLVLLAAPIVLSLLVYQLDRR